MANGTAYAPGPGAAAPNRWEMLLEAVESLGTANHAHDARSHGADVHASGRLKARKPHAGSTPGSAANSGPQALPYAARSILIYDEDAASEGTFSPGGYSPLEARHTSGAARHASKRKRDPSLLSTPGASPSAIATLQMPATAAAAAAPMPASVSGGSKVNVPGGPCMHCGTQESPQWRRPIDRDQVLCNACGIYYGRHRVLPRHKHKALSGDVPMPPGAPPAGPAAAAAPPHHGTPPGGNSHPASQALAAAARHLMLAGSHMAAAAAAVVESVPGAFKHSKGTSPNNNDDGNSHADVDASEATLPIMGSDALGAGRASRTSSTDSSCLHHTHPATHPLLSHTRPSTGVGGSSGVTATSSGRPPRHRRPTAVALQAAEGEAMVATWLDEEDGVVQQQQQHGQRLRQQQAPRLASASAGPADPQALDVALLLGALAAQAASVPPAAHAGVLAARAAALGTAAGSRGSAPGSPQASSPSDLSCLHTLAEVAAPPPPQAPELAAVLPQPQGVVVHHVTPQRAQRSVPQPGTLPLLLPPPSTLLEVPCCPADPLAAPLRAHRALTAWAAHGPTSAAAAPVLLISGDDPVVGLPAPRFASCQAAAAHPRLSTGGGAAAAHRHGQPQQEQEQLADAAAVVAAVVLGVRRAASADPAALLQHPLVAAAAQPVLLPAMRCRPPRTLLASRCSLQPQANAPPLATAAGPAQPEDRLLLPEEVQQVGGAAAPAAHLALHMLASTSVPPVSVLLARGEGNWSPAIATVAAAHELGLRHSSSSGAAAAAAAKPEPAMAPPPAALPAAAAGEEEQAATALALFALAARGPGLAPEEPQEEEEAQEEEGAGEAAILLRVMTCRGPSTARAGLGGASRPGLLRSQGAQGGPRWG